MLPLTRPAIAAVVILNGVWMWNDFFLGFILLTKQDAMTLPVGIMAFRGTYSTEWGLIFASVTISVSAGRRWLPAAVTAVHRRADGGIGEGLEIEAEVFWSRIITL